MRLYKTDAIVLSDFELGDQDKIVTLLSNRLGKVRAVAKGARRLKSRFAPSLQMLSYIAAVLYKSTRGELDTLTECKVNSPFLGIRHDLTRLSYGYYLVELVIKFVRGAETAPFFFDLVLKTISLLEKDPKKNLPVLMRSFELKTLAIFGYQPYLTGCVECHQRIENTHQVCFSGYEGGILCQRCRQGRSGTLITYGTLELMKLLATASLEELSRLRVHYKQSEELKIIPERYIPHRLGEKILSYPFIERVQALEKETARKTDKASLLPS